MHFIRTISFLVLCSVTFVATSLAAGRTEAAESLRLASGLSFDDDASSRFPIEGDRLGDAEIGRGRVTLAFFGAAHCWNTNREAERVVALYPKFRDTVRFIVIDVHQPSEAQRPLLAKYYEGRIPTLVLFATDGSVVHARSGETARKRGDTAALEQLLREALAAKG